MMAGLDGIQSKPCYFRGAGCDFTAMSGDTRRSVRDVQAAQQKGKAAADLIQTTQAAILDTLSRIEHNTQSRWKVRRWLLGLSIVVVVLACAVASVVQFATRLQQLESQMLQKDGLPRDTAKTINNRLDKLEIHAKKEEELIRNGVRDLSNQLETLASQLKSSNKRSDEKVKQKRPPVEAGGGDVLDPPVGVVRHSSGTGYALEWDIDKFRQHVHVNHTRVLGSGPFYSHSAGYLLELKVFPRGAFSSSSGYDVTIDLQIKPGPHDDYLSWPFPHQITVKVLREKVKDHEVILTTAKGYGQQPSGVASFLRAGYTELFPIEDLDGFLHNGTLRVRVAVTGERPIIPDN